MKIMILIFLLMGFCVNAQEGVKNVYAERVELTKEISPKRVQAIVSLDKMEIDSNNVETKINQNTSATTTYDSSKRTIVNSDSINSNKSDKIGKNYAESKSIKVGEKRDSEKYNVED